MTDKRREAEAFINQFELIADAELEEYVNLLEEADIEDRLDSLLKNRTQPCVHCDSTGKVADTFDKLCPECTPVHCVCCGSTKRLTECRATYLSTYNLCPACLADERQQS